MTYGNKHVGLEIRDSLRGFSDELMDLIVSGSQMRSLLRHVPCDEWMINGRDEDCRFAKLPCLSHSVSFPLTCLTSHLSFDRQSSAHCYFQTDLVGSKDVPTRRHRKSHPEPGEKTGPIKGIRSKAKIRPYSAAEANQTVRTHPKHEYIYTSKSSDVISRETAPVRALDSLHPMNKPDHGCL